MYLRKKLIPILAILTLVLNTACNPSPQTQAEEDLELDMNNIASNFLSPRYEDGEGRSFIGYDGRLAILLSEDFKKETTNKYMWLLWGDQDKILDRKLSVIAFHQETGKQESVFVDGDQRVVQMPVRLMGPNHNADAHLPSNMNFSESGKWKLYVFLDDTFIETLNISVEE